MQGATAIRDGTAVLDPAARRIVRAAALLLLGIAGLLLGIVFGVAVLLVSGLVALC